MEKESKARIGEIGTAAVSALGAALALAFIAVSLCRGTLHIMAFFWSALAAGLLAAHTASAIRRIGKGREER